MTNAPPPAPRRVISAHTMWVIGWLLALLVALPPWLVLWRGLSFRPDISARFGSLIMLAMWLWLPVAIVAVIAVRRSRHSRASRVQYSRVAAIVSTVLILASVALAPFLAFLHMVSVWVSPVEDTIVARWSEPASSVEVVVTHSCFMSCIENVSQRVAHNLLVEETHLALIGYVDALDGQKCALSDQIEAHGGGILLTVGSDSGYYILLSRNSAGRYEQVNVGPEGNLCMDPELIAKRDAAIREYLESR